MRRWIGLLLALLIPVAALAQGLGPREVLMDTFSPGRLAQSGEEWQEEGPGVYVLPLLDGGHVCMTAAGDSILSMWAVTYSAEDADTLLKEMQRLFPTFSHEDLILSGSSAYENKHTCYLYRARDAEALCWLPLQGGQCYHFSDGCSSMIAPRLTTVQAAEDRGFDCCQVCREKKLLGYYVVQNGREP